MSGTRWLQNLQEGSVKGSGDFCIEKQVGNGVGLHGVAREERLGWEGDLDRTQVATVTVTHLRNM